MLKVVSHKLMRMQAMIMKTSDWINSTSTCPIQRNTEIHAASAVRKHLKKSAPAHQVVMMAILPDGQWIILDGHTRKHLWVSGKLAMPDFVMVNAFLVESIDEVYELYMSFDSQSAVEGSFDKLQGAYRLYGFTPKSTLVIRGSVTSALAAICGSKLNIYDDIGKWIESLRMIDEENFSVKQFNSGTLAAMILTVSRYGMSAMKFWREFAMPLGGVISDGKMDGVRALREVNMKRQLDKRNGGASPIKDNCLEALACYEAHSKGKMLKRIKTSNTSINEYMSALAA